MQELKSRTEFSKPLSNFVPAKGLDVSLKELDAGDNPLPKSTIFFILNMS